MRFVRKKDPGNRVSALWRAGRLLIAVGAVAMAGGCGDKGDSEPAAQARHRALTPTARDSALVDASAGPSDSISAPGTSVASGVISPRAKDETSLRQTAPARSDAAASAPTSPTRRPRVPSGDGAFSLQLGSFRNANNARVLAERINGLGYVPVIEVASLAGQTYHRVVLHDLPDREEAERVGELIRSRLEITYLIRRK